MSELTKMIKNKLTLAECVPYLRKGMKIRNTSFYSKGWYWKQSNQKNGYDFDIYTASNNPITLNSEDITRSDYEVWE